MSAGDASRVSGETSRSVLAEAPLAMLAHELRNPIGAIRSAVVVMESAGALPGAMEQARGIISRQIWQLSVLVEDLLDLAALSRGTLLVRRERIDVVPEVQAAVEACTWVLDASGHSLYLQVPDTHVYACVDPTLLRQVVTNLLDNACKYTPARGRICVVLESSADHLELRVEDNGAGIANDRLPYVFDLYMRARGVGESPIRGLGFGLALVREIVQLHSGTVEAKSAGAGAGSTFIVRLPARCPIPPV